MKLFTAALSFALVAASGAAFAQTGAKPSMPATRMEMSMQDKQMMSSCMGMTSSAMMKNTDCMGMMKKMNMSSADMKKMKACQSMSSDKMMKDKKCIMMKDMHPDMMMAKPMNAMPSKP